MTEKILLYIFYAGTILYNFFAINKIRICCVVHSLF